MKIKGLKLGVTNCFLIEADNKHVLIDTGYERDWGLFCKRLKEVNVSLSDISHVVLTHHHDDHSGLLSSLLQANKDIRIVMSSHARELLATGENDRAPRACCVNRRSHLLVSWFKLSDRQWRTHTFPPYKPRDNDIQIQRETSLDDIGIGLSGKILATPGHSVDSITLLLQDGSCFVGDAASNMPGFMGTKYCVIIVEDIEEYYKSWRALLSAGAGRIFPAHGNPFNATELAQNLGAIRRSNLLAL